MKKQVLFRFAEAAEDQRNCEMTAVLSIGRCIVMSVKRTFHEECQDIPVEAKQIDFPWSCKSCKERMLR